MMVGGAGVSVGGGGSKTTAGAVAAWAGGLVSGVDDAASPGRSGPASVAVGSRIGVCVLGMAVGGGVGGGG